MINPRTKTEWLVYWQQHLDNHQSRRDNPDHTQRVAVLTQKKTHTRSYADAGLTLKIEQQLAQSNFGVSDRSI
ncbi:hypothetical protein [Pseudomonas gingeri]|uniref:hypothetical protein n=1 Tax=Pseudomonas gingeri TaxID=117681 RepID=UPI0015A2D052|nr:hypothetical protein [Pseudomonas gingeri]NWD04114.1 hypothetical protein [Pseudomonas gingeri]NWE33912.1 hypothetical protein [Pseudomonas gingeri]NWE58002.1 hypothetical protein [Pseudomonas gingeri]NWF04361.1 hypothetical protein [Pseudomonas gingeri]